MKDEPDNKYSQKRKYTEKQQPHSYERYVSNINVSFAFIFFVLKERKQSSLIWSTYQFQYNISGKECLLSTRKCITLGLMKHAHRSVFLTIRLSFPEKQ